MVAALLWLLLVAALLWLLLRVSIFLGVNVELSFTVRPPDITKLEFVPVVAGHCYKLANGAVALLFLALIIGVCADNNSHIFFSYDVAHRFLPYLICSAGLDFFISAPSISAPSFNADNIAFLFGVITVLIFMYSSGIFDSSTM